MKHILNNLTEEEKNAIREQHVGGKSISTENFSRLVNSKLGDSKPFLMEQGAATNQTGNDRIANIASNMNSLKTVNKPTQVIVSKNPNLNNMSWNDYVKKYKITPFEIAQAKQLSQKMGVGQNQPQTTGGAKQPQKTAPTSGATAVATAQPTNSGPDNTGNQ